MKDKSIYTIIFLILVALSAFSLGFFFGIEYGVNKESINCNINYEKEDISPVMIDAVNISDNGLR